MSATETPLVPWSEEAEQAILGALMLAPDAMLQLADEGLQPNHFHSAAHREIFGAIAAMHATHRTADVISVFELLRDRKVSEACGGLEYVNELSQAVYSAANIRRHAVIVMERALRRQIIEMADQVQAMAREPGDPAQIRDRAAALFTSIETRSRKAGPQFIGDLMAARSAHWDALSAGTVAAGMSTGFEILDKNLGGGLKGGRVIVVAARPTIGKTSFATQIGLNVAGAGNAVLMLSQEMEKDELADRIASNLGRLTLDALSNGTFEKDDWGRSVEAVERAANLPFAIDDRPALSLLDIRAIARQHQHRYGLKVLIVDYLQLCSATGKHDSRHHQIEQISRGMKQLAKELNICILLLSQVNRQSTNRADGEPLMADLKESGAVEEDADTVLLLHPKGVNPDGSQVIAGILAKNRQGKRGRIALALYGATQRWTMCNADVSKQGGA